MQLLLDTATLDADLLQIDAEGYDSAILRMTDFARFRPRLIKYEHKAMTLANGRRTTQGWHGTAIARSSRERTRCVAELAGLTAPRYHRTRIFS
jgi:hypothetical protein